MTYEEAVRYLYGFINYERVRDVAYTPRTFNLVRMRALLTAFGDPHLAYRTIHVVGTNGKGSIAAFFSTILRGAGYRTALYTKPHLVSFRERLVVDGEAISKPDVVVWAERLQEATARVPQDLGQVTFFEAWTALAFAYFREAGANIAVIEAGLGGKLDATNVIEPTAVTFGPIHLDHVRKLGPTPLDQAQDKSQTIKPGVVVASAPQLPEVAAVLKARCRDMGSTLRLVGRDYETTTRSAARDGTSFDLTGPGGHWEGLEITLPGAFQLDNAATAVVGVELLRERGFVIPDAAIRDGLRRTRWPGRLDVVATGPTVVLDAAHNPHGAEALRSAIEQLFAFDRLILVAGLSSEKDIGGFMEVLAPLASEVILTMFSNPRAASPEAILAAAQMLDPGRVIATTSVPEALAHAQNLAGPNDLILVTGSVLTIGEAMKQYRKLQVVD